jgi:hypothetical protein
VARAFFSLFLFCCSSSTLPLPLPLPPPSSIYRPHVPDLAWCFAILYLLGLTFKFPRSVLAADPRSFLDSIKTICVETRRITKHARCGKVIDQSSDGSYLAADPTDTSPLFPLRERNYGNFGKYCITTSQVGRRWR